MKRLIALGVLVGTVILGGTAVAGEGGGTLMQRELEKLFEWSARAAETAKQQARTAGPAAQPTREIPPVLEYRGSEIR